MPKLTFSKEKVEQSFPVVDEGIYEIRCDGFTPKKNKDWDNKPSINLNPVLTLIGSDNGMPVPTLGNGKPMTIMYSLNTSAEWIMSDFCHCFGLPLEKVNDTEFTIPGDFQGPEGDPSQWQYRGPLMGRKGKVFLVKTDYKGKPQNKVKYFVCAISDCNVKYPSVTHSTDLK